MTTIFFIIMYIGPYHFIISNSSRPTIYSIPNEGLRTVIEIVTDMHTKPLPNNDLIFMHIGNILYFLNEIDAKIFLKGLYKAYIKKTNGDTQLDIF